MPERLARRVRYALKVAYDGTRFSGSQVQPDARTVHGEMAKALRAMDLPETRLLWAGRTDAGVSARGNVVALESPLAPASLVAGLSFRMDDAWAWAWAEVPDAFEPRHARRRWYRYHLRTKLDVTRLERALAPFVGTHDFSAFCRLEPDVDPRRTVFSATVTPAGEFALVDILGESFVWNQVRRMVEAARRVAAGDLPRDAIEEALARPRAMDMGTAPAEPLVLMDVQYDGLVFHDERGRALQRLDRRVEEAELRLALLRTLRDEPAGSGA